MPAAREDYVSPSAKGRFMVAIDRHGKLAYSQNFLDRHGVRSHIVEVLTENVSCAYINYLRKMDISYIFAGKNDLDCTVCMAKLRELFGIERLMIAGGGYIEWAFAADAENLAMADMPIKQVAELVKLTTAFTENMERRFAEITNR